MMIRHTIKEHEFEMTKIMYKCTCDIIKIQDLLEIIKSFSPNSKSKPNYTIAKALVKSSI